MARPRRASALENAMNQERSPLGDAGTDVPLAEARDLFASMGFKPALAETDALLAQTAARAS
jgi:hypothetical protein